MCESNKVERSRFAFASDGSPLGCKLAIGDEMRLFSVEFQNRGQPPIFILTLRLFLFISKGKKDMQLFIDL